MQHRANIRYRARIRDAIMLAQTAESERRPLEKQLLRENRSISVGQDSNKLYQRQ